ncbi:MAG: hypothetical protein DMG63_09220, partial [Acidobacteria bacterium]
QQVHDAVRNALSDMPVRISAAHGREQGFELVRSQQPRIILLDPQVPSARDSDLLGRIVLQDPRSEVILISEDYSPAAAVDAILKGAADYLTKPLSTHHLRARVGQAIEAARRNLHTLSRSPRRERDVRLRERGFHRRERNSRRSIRACPRRHNLPGRNWRHADGHTGQASAGTANP